MERTAEGWRIPLPAREPAGARRELAEYERVNANWPPYPQADPTAEPPSRGGGVESLVSALALLVMYWRTGPASEAGPFTARGCAESARIVSGEWWRAVTALTLHGDLTHVLGNAACFLCFGWAVGRQVGGGTAWLLILLSGALGNLLNAYLTDLDHSAIGGSTAAFGAVGLLTVFQFARNYRRYKDLRSVWGRSWVPVGAAAAMLAMLGADPSTDLGGHLWGLAAGLGLGAAALPLLEKETPEWVQAVLYVVFGAIISCAWRLALAGR